MSNGSLKLGCASVIIFCFIGTTIGALTWPYTINTWLVYCGREPLVTWWQGSLIGFVPVIGQLSIPGTVATWITMLFVT